MPFRIWRRNPAPPFSSKSLMGEEKGRKRESMQTLSKLIQSILKKFTFSLSILLFFYGTSLGHSAAPSAPPTVRVAVKTKVPLTQEVVDQLNQYGQVNRRMWKINIVDMQVPTQNLSALAAEPLVQYVEPDQEVHFEKFS